jgi:tyrosyl-tRNA synthetase
MDCFAASESGATSIGFAPLAMTCDEAEAHKEQMQNFIDIITERGFVHQMTDEAGLRALLETKGQTAYIGFDCTAKSLHVGSLLQIMLLRWWQKCGHRPIVLLGGGTTKIGDPSGKDESRPPLTDAQISENMDSLKQVFSKFLKFSTNENPHIGNDAIMVNNDDWLKDLNYPKFLRDYGRYFSVNRMLTMDSVKLRLEREQNLSFLEFNYMILQAYDFVELNRRHGCRVQMGGSDQWGNIVNGIDLQTAIHFQDPCWHEIPSGSATTKDNIRRHIFDNHPNLISGKRIKNSGITSDNKIKFSTVDYFDDLFGITSPLLTTSSGAKMGKTAAGAVWLNADLLSPYDYWQFWRNTEDADVVKFLKLFTEIPLTEKARAASDVKWAYSIEQLAALEGAGINEAKKVLATEATAMLHGREAAERAAQTAADTFSGSGVSADLPQIDILASEVAAGTSLIRWVVKASFAASNGEARRLIEGSGISVNDIKITDANYFLTQADFAQGFAKLSKGKKQHVLVKIV